MKNAVATPLQYVIPAYAEVEAPPFSRFTSDPAEQAANTAWRARAVAWAAAS